MPVAVAGQGTEDKAVSGTAERPARVIIYEVTLTLPALLATEYDEWLAGHVAEMLRLPGFMGADIVRAAEPDAGQVTRVVRYRLANRAALDNYLDRHAAAMRAAGVARFGEAVTATRRILETAQDGPVCDNCGSELSARYCAVCGQDSHIRVTSLFQLIHDFFSDYLNFDSRLVRSLAPLLWRPGFLTNEYLAGRRARYIKPLRMYLFISVTFFFLLSLASMGIDWFGSTAAVPAQVKLSPEHAARLAEKPIWVQHLAHRAMVYKNQPLAFFSDMISKLPSMMFVLLPLFAFFMKLLYIRRKRFYVEHLIFSFHYHAVIFLSAIVFLAAYVAADRFGLKTVNGKLSLALWIYLTLYLIVAMRAVYRQGWGKTLVKWSLLACGYGIALSIALAVVMAWVVIV